MPFVSRYSNPVRTVVLLLLLSRGGAMVCEDQGGEVTR